MWKKILIIDLQNVKYIHDSFLTGASFVQLIIKNDWIALTGICIKEES